MRRCLKAQSPESNLVPGFVMNPHELGARQKLCWRILGLFAQYNRNFGHFWQSCSQVAPVDLTNAPNRLPHPNMV